jgi:sulfur-oxidizing protein SoxX
MNTDKKILIGVATGAGIALLLAGCASTMTSPVTPEQALASLESSFKERGQAKMDRLDQDDAQKLCSFGPGSPPPKEVLEALQSAQLAQIQYPADGQFLGDWREGEKIAQSGTGKQFSDNPAAPAGGNCYACHQMTPQEISYGTIGPSLLGYGRQRGNSAAIQKYTYGKIYNSQAYVACSNMPRFGHKGILSEKQIKDLTALLVDPDSPVNR